MRALGRNPTEAQVRQLAKEVDPDGRGSITLQGKRRAAHRAEGLLAASGLPLAAGLGLPADPCRTEAAAGVEGAAGAEGPRLRLPAPPLFQRPARLGCVGVRKRGKLGLDRLGIVE
jgi:hypothetical protein